MREIFVIKWKRTTMYLKNLFKFLSNLKKNNKIQKVIMYTSAANCSNNQDGYIYFLKDCLELYCNTPKLYDSILHRNNVTNIITKEGIVLKDLSNIILSKKVRKLYYKLKKINKKLENSNYINYKIIYNQIKDNLNEKSKWITMIDDKPKNIIKYNSKIIKFQNI